MTLAMGTRGELPAALRHRSHGRRVARRGRAAEMEREGVLTRGRLLSATGPALNVESTMPQQRCRASSALPAPVARESPSETSPISARTPRTPGIARSAWMIGPGDGSRRSRDRRTGRPPGPRALGRDHEQLPADARRGADRLHRLAAAHELLLARQLEINLHLNAEGPPQPATADRTRRGFVSTERGRPPLPDSRSLSTWTLARQSGPAP